MVGNNTEYEEMDVEESDKTAELTLKIDTSDDAPVPTPPSLALTKPTPTHFRW